MEQFNGIIRDVDSVPVSGALVYIYDQFGELADIYFGDATPKQNPIVTPENGYWEAWLNDGLYTQRVNYGGRERYVATNLTVGGSADLTLRGELASDAPDYGASLVELEGGGSVQEFVDDLNSPDGSSEVGYHRASLLTAAQYRTLSEKADDRFDLRDMNGLDLTGANDMASLVQAAINEATSTGSPLHIPCGIIAVDSSIPVTASGLAMLGSSRASKGLASRFLFTSLDEGFILGDGLTDYEEGFLFRDLVTSRLQPAIPANGTDSWTPVDAAADFVMNGAADLDLEHVLLLNSTRGVNMEGGGGIGRLNMTNCGGQAFVYGVNIELAADSCRFDNVHWWPYWSDTRSANDFSCANLDAFFIKRCDTPMFSNVFAIAARSSFRFGNNAFGGVTKAKISNAGLDYSTTNIWFDDTSEDAYAFFSNVTMGANDSDGSLANINATNPRRNIRMEGTNCFLSIVNYDLGGASGSAAEIEGTSNELRMSGGAFIHNYGTVGASTDPCFYAASGSRVIIDGDPRIDAPGAGPTTGGAGTFQGVRQSYVPSVTAQAGTLTSVALAEAKFLRQGNQVTGTVTMAFSDAGSATGYIRVSAPISIDHTFTAVAANVSTSQPVLVVSIAGDPGYLQLFKVGGGNVAVTGETLTLSFTYEVGDPI